MGQVLEFRPVSSAPAAEETPAKRINMDDGHTRIAHGLLEELMQAKYKLSGREYAVLLVVIRKTYGYMKSEDWIALSQFELMTGIEKSNCRKVILSLVDRKILMRTVSGNDQRLAINVNVSDWLLESPSKKAAASKRKIKKQPRLNSTISESDSTISESNSTISESNSTPTIDKYNNNILKDYVPTHVETFPIEKPIEKIAPVDQENPIPDATEMVSKEPSPVQPKGKSRKRTLKFEPADREFAEHMLERIELVNGSQGKTNLDQWANDIRLMREQDGHSPEDIARLFHFANNHPVQVSSSGRRFTWSAVIRCPAKLRLKWSDLMAQYRLDQRFHTQSGAHHENYGSAGQQHRSQQEYIDDISWLDR